MKRLLAIVCILPLLLSGCNWLDGSYQSITPHTENGIQLDPDNLSATDLAGLIDILTQMVRIGAEEGVIALDKYDRNLVSADVQNAILQVTANDPVAAYAVRNIQYEFGTSGGKLAAAVSIEYSHSPAEIRRIMNVPSTALAKEAISNAMNECSTDLVLYVNNFTDADFVRYATTYADLYPDRIMECPGVSVNIYPETGAQRVVEVKFTYRTNIVTLKNMQKLVDPFFEASLLLVSGSNDEQQKFSQLYALLMNRFDYRLETSVTPAYSLLQDGIGDSKAIADVYGAMCRKANLDCQTVSGTRNGEPWHWNTLRIGDSYYHVDLLACKQAGAFRLKQSHAMTDYVWDQSAVPATNS